MTMSREQVVPLARCCSTHTDLPTLVDHLVAEFVELSVAEVAAEVARADRAVRSVRLEEDRLVMVELIARQQLMMRAGRACEVARLDPQSHVRSDRGPITQPPRRATPAS